MTSERLAIAQVTPFAWEVVERGQRLRRARLARAFPPRASRADHRAVGVGRARARQPPGDPERRESLLERADGEPLVLGVGEVLPFSPTRRRAASLPVDVARTIEEALLNLTLDLVHVHEPFAPSASSVALRHSRGAERRQLPCADRTDALDAAHRPAVAPAVRAARRPDRQLRRDPGPPPALLPRRVPGDPPGCRRRLGAHRARSRAGSVQRGRGARRASHLPARRCERSPPTPSGARPSGRRGR